MNDNQVCQHLISHLPDYVDGTAAAAICAEIEAHMAGCENCRIVVDTLRQTIHLYHTLPEPDLPDGARQRLYKRLDLEQYLPRSH
ncbi:MAG TPA: zf-HC2 domain-containing protein [Candidatus Binatia bacterium]|nr:zf-HC2 domain-containing protein [Candidatus Binatia bacterium]